MTVWRAGSRLVVGHRGGRGASWPPENTIEAFERARREGAGAVELDVRASADGHAIVMHDRTLSRMARATETRRVDEVSLDALRAVDLGAGVRIPSLREVLAWARDAGMGVNVELKHDVPSRRAVVGSAIAAVGAVAADVLFSSFDPILVSMLAAGACRWPRALLTYAGQSRGADLVQELARPPWAQAIHVERDQAASRGYGGAGLELAVRFRRRGLRVAVWTVNDARDAQAMFDQGVDWVITDQPGVLVEATRARGQSQVTDSTDKPGGIG